ncbi:3718_t:CDS:2, partial [Paraglomus occultum]
QMYKEPSTTVASIILGTGTNAACIVPIAEIQRPSFSFPQTSASDRMVINMEWSLMGADFLAFTDYDRQLDKDRKPGFQPFEKMISGYYLHELVRLAIVDFVDKKELFGGVLPSGMERKYSFTSELMSDFERCSIDRPEELISKLSSRYQLPDDIKVRDLEIIQSIVKCFSRRSAQLVAAGIAALVEFTHPEATATDVTIGIDGSVHSHYHGYSDMLTNEVESLTRTRVRISEVKDGGCVGAAIVAMLYAKKSM